MKEVQVETTQVVQEDVKKKAAGKGKQEEQKEIEVEPLKDKRMIKLELFLDDKIICYSYGQSAAYLSNVILDFSIGT